MLNLHGFHDEGGEYLHGDKPGWTVITEEVGLDTTVRGRDYSHLANQGVGVVVRLNHSHTGGGTLPLPKDYTQFAAACQSFAATSKGVWGWIVANEPNHQDERPQGQIITPEQYVEAYGRAARWIKQALPQTHVGPAAPAPYHADPIPWTNFLSRVLTGILRRGDPVDWLPIHAYTRGMDSLNIFSDAKMGPPLAATFSGFRTFEDYLAQVPVELRGLPTGITEFDAYGPWEDRNSGVIQQMYRYVQGHNEKVGTQKVIFATCFRWLVGLNHVDWGMANKPNLLEDFRLAIEKGYTAPLGLREPTTGGAFTVFIPDVRNEEGEEEEEPQMDDELMMDPRLVRRGVKVVRREASPGETVWRLIRARWFDVPEAGGRHHIYVETLDEQGRPVGDVRFLVTWPTGKEEEVSKPFLGFDAGNYAMSGSLNEYTVEVAGGDAVTGIGMGKDGNKNEHTATLLTYQRRKASGTPAEPPQTPAERPPVSIPRLLHPVTDPSLRRVTQRFGENEAYYREKFGIQGHNGVDYGTPAGSLIRAVDRGQVVEAQESPSWGRYVKLRHEWGESLYAHLDSIAVGLKPGATVTAGSMVGRSGWSGNVEPKGPLGAHLHFGLRVFPYERGWPYDGYRDPLPYLEAQEELPASPAETPSRKELVRLVLAAAGEAGLDWRVLVSLVHAESSFVPTKVSARGAKGLGQIMPDTWAEWSVNVGMKGADPFDPRANVKVTAFYLEWCIEQMGGSVRRGLWGYVWGVTRTKKALAEGRTPPEEVTNYASKVIHGAEAIDLALLTR